MNKVSKEKNLNLITIHISGLIVFKKYTFQFIYITSEVNFTR